MNFVKIRLFISILIVIEDTYSLIKSPYLFEIQKEGKVLVQCVCKVYLGDF